MIEGFKLDFSSAEIVAHLNDRAAHHEKRVAQYAEQLRAFGDLPASNTSNDPRHSLEGSRKHHADRYALFVVMAAHVVPSETYRLCENDLTRLEILADRW